MARLDHYDRAIIHFLGNRGESNTNEVADGVGISWITADTHLKKLNSIGYILTRKKGKIIYWRLNYQD